MGLRWLLLIRMMMSKREALAHGAAVRLHDVRGERSNVPREARYFTERGWMKKIR